MSKRVKIQLDFVQLVALMKGEKIILLRENEKPTIEITLEKPDIKEFLEDAVSDVENYWGLCE